MMILKQHATTSLIKKNKDNFRHLSIAALSIRTTVTGYVFETVMLILVFSSVL